MTGIDKRARLRVGVQLTEEDNLLTVCAEQGRAEQRLALAQTDTWRATNVLGGHVGGGGIVLGVGMCRGTPLCSRRESDNRSPVAEGAKAKARPAANPKKGQPG